MTYTPNFRDPRTRRRATQALTWAQATLSPDKPRAWSKKHIDRIFGTQNHDLSAWLRQQLLLVASDRYNMHTGKCKQYLLNLTGAQQLDTDIGAATLRPLTEAVEQENLLRDLVGIFQGRDTNSGSNITTPTTKLLSVAQVAKNLSQEFGPELASREFLYTDKSHRLWHPLQSIRREYRTEILTQSGLTYDWDIECAAPTLLLQQARMVGGLTEPTPTIDALIADRSWFRTELAADTGITLDQAKQVVNALFCGAKISFNPEFSSIARYLDSDRDRIWQLRSSPLLQALRLEIKMMWASLAWTQTRREITDKNGRERLLPISSRQKWDVYFTQERRVLEAVRWFFRLCEIKYFLIHDGWATDQDYDPEELAHWIWLKTGFVIRISDWKADV